jgi:hypothetical protein
MFQAVRNSGCGHISGLWKRVENVTRGREGNPRADCLIIPAASQALTEDGL